MLFRRYGCHHCGKRFGQVIADHQPPNKTVYGARHRAHRAALLLLARSRWRPSVTPGSSAAAAAAAVAQKVAADNPVVVRGARCQVPCFPCLVATHPTHDPPLRPQVTGLRFAYPQLFSRLFAAPRQRQRFFPQCASCSSLQSDALRRSVKKLVAHFGGVQPFGYAGVLLGLRQYSAPQEGRGTQRGTSLENWLAKAQAHTPRWR